MIVIEIKHEDTGQIYEIKSKLLPYDWFEHTSVLPAIKNLDEDKKRLKEVIEITEAEWKNSNGIYQKEKFFTLPIGILAA